MAVIRTSNQCPSAVDLSQVDRAHRPEALEAGGVCAAGVNVFHTESTPTDTMR